MGEGRATERGGGLGTCRAQKYGVFLLLDAKINHSKKNLVPPLLVRDFDPSRLREL